MHDAFKEFLISQQLKKYISLVYQKKKTKNSVPLVKDELIKLVLGKIIKFSHIAS